MLGSRKGENSMKEEVSEERPEGEQYLTPSAAARFAEKSEGWIRHAANIGKLPCIRTSTGVRLFRRADLQKFISG
jgi:hypothetical protein